ncbi:hypothetical protein SCHPADRAFT_567992 [Schizopora paradoxa]|uniref:Uncharacterized protein n=1 Tax=Schizopora paradoxa TaxID=27342 RepID=A0A0H2RJ29_9AGAM|nr:hypothetical protein SCHPADRAFT_567992 [Schizopora paradoxa]
MSRRGSLRNTDRSRDDAQPDWLKGIQSKFPEISIREPIWYFTRRIEPTTLIRRDVFVDYQAVVTKVTCPNSETFYISDSLDPATLAGIIDAMPSKGLECFIHHIRQRGWNDKPLPKNTPIIMWPTDVHIAPDERKKTFTLSVRSRIYFQGLQKLHPEEVQAKSIHCMQIRYEMEDMEDVIKILKGEYVEPDIKEFCFEYMSNSATRPQFGVITGLMPQTPGTASNSRHFSRLRP